MKDFRTIWKKLANEKKLESYHFIQRAVLIAMASQKNMPKEDIVHIKLDKFYTPITNKNKLANGRNKYDTVSRDAYYAKTRKVLGVNPSEFFDNDAEHKEFVKLIDSIRLDKIDRKYVYYFTVQENLTPEQQGVQAGHALFALGSKLGNKADPNETYFQWIGVGTDAELATIKSKYQHLSPVVFYEPDLDHKMTSVALPPVSWYSRGDLVNYKLLTHEQ